MKTLQFLILASLFSTPLLSQDTLYTRNGEIILGKVMEVNQDNIKYKRPSNLDGPLYVAKKSDIVLIHYKNGSKDVFASTANSSDNSQNAQSNQSSQNNQSNNNQNNNQPNYGYGNQGGGLNVIVGASPFFGYRPWGWGWGGGGWGGGWGRSYYGGGYYRGGGFNHYGGGGGGHFGHYGRHR